MANFSSLVLVPFIRSFTMLKYIVARYRKIIRTFRNYTETIVEIVEIPSGKYFSSSFCVTVVNTSLRGKPDVDESCVVLYWL